MSRIFKSKVTRVMPTSSSLRATIPEGVAALIGAEHGSTLLWETEPGSTKVVVSVEEEKGSQKAH